MTTLRPLPWRPAPLIAGSLLLHAALPVFALAFPAQWPWALAALIGNHAVLTAAGLWPRSAWLGPNWTKLPPAAAARREIALTIDDGPDPEVTPRVLDLLDAHDVKATFFCIGELAARHPALCREIVARGHDIENHSQHHRHHFSVMGPGGQRREVETAQETIASITGRKPRFFRAPAGLRNPFLDAVLARAGLRLAAWSRRGFDTRTPDAAVVARRLLRGLEPGAILLLHDGHCARTPSGAPVILEALPFLIDAARKANLRFVTLSSTLPDTQS